jgi:hypothetical protein
MKIAKVFSIASDDAPGYAWKWRSADSKIESAEVFTLYHDCLMDAQKQGYEVELTRAQGLTAPGGKQHGMT